MDNAMDNAMDSPSLQNSKELLRFEDDLKQKILADEQEYAKKVEQLEKATAERETLESERNELERRLEVAQLIGAQQRLANLDMQIKLDLMRMGNLQLDLEEKRTMEEKSTPPKDA